MVKLTTLLVTLPYGLDTTTSYAPAFPKPTSFNTSVGPWKDYFADAVVIVVRNEQVAGGVHRHASGINTIQHWSPRPRRRSNRLSRCPPPW